MLKTKKIKQTSVLKPPGFKTKPGAKLFILKLGFVRISVKSNFHMNVFTPGLL